MYIEKRTDVDTMPATIVDPSTGSPEIESFDSHGKRLEKPLYGTLRYDAGGAPLPYNIGYGGNGRIVRGARVAAVSDGKALAYGSGRAYAQHVADSHAHGPDEGNALDAEVQRRGGGGRGKAMRGMTRPRLTFMQKLKRMIDFRKIFNVQGKVAFSVLGIALISLGITICNLGEVGVDPFTAMNMGISERLGLPFGTFQLFMNLAILIAVFTLDSSQLGIGTLINMVAVGYLIEFFTWVLTPLPLIGGLVGGAMHLVVGTLVFTLGVSMYMKTRMGVSPIDAIAPIAAKRLPFSFTVCRMAQDILVMVIALVIGGPVGVFTIVSAFCIGPLITLWNRTASLPLYERFNVLNRQEIAEEA